MSGYPFYDMREFMEALEAAGELVRVKTEVDWNLEASAIIRRTNEIGAPAPFFQKIKGYPEGFNRMMGGQMGGSVKGVYRRPAIAMGLDPDTHESVIIDEFIRRMNNPIKPVIVKTGPCKENILKGDDVDLTKFPAPMIHKGDGGRYICTWHAQIVKDPDSDWVNWGMYRLHILGKKTLASQVEAFRHEGVMFYEKYEPRNKPMSVAVAIGPDPLCAIAACTDAPAGVSEVDVAGGLRGAPVELVKCETSDLYVPASAEIIIEGTVMPGERAEEGPHGEYTGYRVSERSDRERLFVRVDCITHRNNPILPSTCMGMPVDDGHAAASLTQSAAILQEVRKKGIDVKGLYVPPYGPWASAIVSIKKKPYPAFIHELAAIIWSTQCGRQVNYVIFLEETANLYNPLEVLHEIIFRCHPIRGIRRFEQGPGSPLLPYLTAYERHYMFGVAAIIDCTAPMDWPFPPIELRFTNPTMYPKDLQEKILSKWKEYGF